MNIKEIFSDSFIDEHGNYVNKINSKEINALQQHGLLKCFLPHSFGGLNYGLKGTLDLIKQCAYLNGSLGWLVQIGNGGNYFLSSFKETVAHDLFDNKDAVIAGSGAISGKAKKVEGGYFVSGQWKYCSGSDYATLFTANCQLEESSEYISIITPRENVEIINDWDTIGLTQTSTNSIRLENTFIPDEHVFDVHNHQFMFNDEIQQLPFYLFAQVFFKPVVDGLFERILDEAEKISKESIERWNLSQPGRYESILELIKKSRNHTLVLNTAINDSLDKILLNQIETEGLSMSYNNAIHYMRDSINKLIPMIGMRALDVREPIAIAYMDLLATTQHSLLNTY